MNKVILTGNMAQDLETSMTTSGKLVGRSSIAVKRERKNADGEYDVDFINFIVWEKNAEYMKNFSSKGCRLELVGRWQVRDVVSDDGKSKRYNEVVVESINCIKKDKDQETQEAPFTYDDAMKNEVEKNNFDDKDLPF